MGFGIAIVNGVTRKGFPVPTMGGWPVSARCWSTMPPHDDAAGDQITGFGPCAASSQFVYRSCAARPDDLLCGRTNTQPPPATLALSEPLNDLAKAVIRSPFSGDTAM